jgi:type I restriction enzyme R subunit
MSDAHQEKHLESYIVQKLVDQGWLLGKSANYDKEHALYPEDLVGWLKDTQSAKWEKLSAMNGAKTEKVLMDRLESALKNKGTIHVLRNGFSIAGCGSLDMSEAAPEDRRNEDSLHRYKSNRLRVVPQLKYHPTRELAIDLGFFLNGLPVATVELKTDFTQSSDDARNQYKKDRLPAEGGRKHPLLTFNRGAVVHFAMSDSQIWMTTKLAGDNTFFLPFNQGRDGSSGNPARDDGEYPVAYFWENICQPDAWLRIFHNFVYVETKNVVDLRGNWSEKETLMFPRFHQWSAVNAMIADAREKGPGQSYLCEHSAGSGKTSTIAWTAHDLIKMRKDDGTAIFDGAIIVTDRNVLDSQLQDAVQQLDHQTGLIAAIDRETSSKSKSKQLADALLKGVPIIVVTIQTFPYAMEAILTQKSLKDKNYAVIIDEAHTSQTGTTASKLQATLAMKSNKDSEGATVEELLAAIQSSRSKRSNISQFAFTATPKHSTMMLFGRPADPTQPASDENLRQSFHKYPMRQAIDEGFILDVLQGYVPYKTAFNLGKDLVDQKRVDDKSAKRALAKWMTLHPTNVTQKVQFIIEHFSQNVAHLLDGKAKAMVVTSSRAAAVRYKKSFDAFIETNPDYREIRALVAFSGKLSAEDVMHSDDELLAEDIFLPDDAEFTEANMNPDVKGGDLRIAFDRPEYRVMLVANKFQTGFDQPKLTAMYLDKKIANPVEIVQTFSRLNRTFPGKDQTFIIDFVNDPKQVQSAFAQYDKGAKIESEQDLNVIYDLQDRLNQVGIYDFTHLEAFKAARFKTARDFVGGGEPQHRELFAATQEPTDCYNDRLHKMRNEARDAEALYQRSKVSGNKDGMSTADFEIEQAKQEIGILTEFKAALARFTRTYAYIAQLIDLGDPDLENYAAFAKLLAKRLEGVAPEAVDLSGLTLSGYAIKAKVMEGNVDSDDEDEDDLTLKPIGSGGSQSPGSLPIYLIELIEKLNNLAGDVAPLKDTAHFVNQLTSIARENKTVMAQVDANTKAQALKGNLTGAVQAAVYRAMASNNDLATLFLKSDSQAMEMLKDLIYDQLKSGRNIDLGDLEHV